MNCNKFEKKTPNAIENWLSAPIDPDISVGESSLIIKGAKALYNPTQTPCMNLAKKIRN